MITEQDISKLGSLAYGMSNARAGLARSSIHSVGHAQFQEDYWAAVYAFDAELLRLQNLVADKPSENYE